MANTNPRVVRESSRGSWTWFVLFAIVFGIISGVIYSLFVGNFNPISFELAPVKVLPTAAIRNNRLSDASQVSISPHTGGESMVYVNGSLYTGTLDGKILRIKNSTIEVFVDLNKPNCDSLATCGRPLGMRLSRDGKNLLFVDAYQGVFSVSFEKKKVLKLFPVNPRVQFKFLDDFDILPNGNILLSEASMNYSLDQLVYEVLESRPNGRLLLIDPKSGNWRVLKHGLHFANGVQLHRDGKSVLVAETTRARVLRIPLDGKRPITVFADGLPGLPDNIRLSPRGGYWVPVSNIRDGSWLSRLTNWSSGWPSVRRLLLRVTSLPPLAHLKQTKSSMLLRLDEQGKVIEAWQDPQNRVTNVAEVCEAAGHLFTGSYYLPFIGKLEL